MTQPIQEPTDQRAIAGMGWAQSQLARRPPIVNASLQPNFFCSMDMGDIGTIPSGAWTSVVVNNGYDEADTSDPDNAGFSPDLATGCIQAGPGYFLAQAYARPNDTYAVGTNLAVAIDFGNGCSFASLRVANQVNADGLIEDTRISVSAPFINPEGVVGPDSIRMLVYQNSGSDKGWGDCRLALIYVNSPAITILP